MPETERWYIARAAPLGALRQALQGCGLRWVYAERMETTVLTTLADLLAGDAPPERWQHGRAFERRLELAWWQSAHGWDLRAILVEGALPGSVAWQEDRRAAKIEPLEEEKLFLFGERGQGQSAWSAVRIPRYLHYPLEGGPERVALCVRPYQVDSLRCDQRLLEVTEAKP
jgi:hypothetical protein